MADATATFPSSNVGADDGVNAGNSEASAELGQTRRASGRVAVIGGTSLHNSSMFKRLNVKQVETSYGMVECFVSDCLVYVNRHHTEPGGKYAQPHAINYQGMAAALMALEVRVIYAVCSTGALKKEIKPGALVLLADYHSLFADIVHLYDDGRAHIVPTLDSEARQRVVKALTRNNLELSTQNAVYVQTRGPRLETPAEIRTLVNIQAGDVVGMTGASEATVACEAGIPYAAICMVDNYANGIVDEPLTMEQFFAKGKYHNFPVIPSIQPSIINRCTNFILSFLIPSC